jgi:hypothetical protein
MTMHLGYALSSGIFLALFLITVTVQLSSRAFHPFLYWSVIVATTTAGTTMADFADHSLGIGYVGGSLLLLASLMAILGLWRLGDHPLFEYARDCSRRLHRGRLGSGVRRGGHRFCRCIGAYRHRSFLHRNFSHLAILASFRLHPSTWRDIRRFLNKAAGSRRTQFRAHHLIPGDRDLHLRMHPVYVTKSG